MTHFLFSLVLPILILLPPAHGLGSATTLAVIHNTSTVCGVLAATTPRSILCYSLNQTQQPIPLLPNTSFLSISAGASLLCGLRADSAALFCWDASSPSPSNYSPKRLYIGRPELSSLTVGEDHAAAAIEDGEVWFWRGRGRFPANVIGSFESLTSGNGFSCGILNTSVKCWGSGGGRRMETYFKNFSMVKIVAGDSHMCGVDTNGALVCKGWNNSGQLGSDQMLSSLSPFEFFDLALGATHTCGIRRSNGTVVCWGGGGGSDGGAWYSPIGSMSMEVIVAGGNLTCGITAMNFSVMCWSLQRFPPLVLEVRLPPILPGLCTAEGSCRCGVFPDSERLCSGSGVICEFCDRRSSRNSPPMSSSPSSPPSSPPGVTTGNGTSKGFLAFAIIGSVGGFAGICTVLYCLIFGVCRQKKVHNSVQPTIAGAANGANSSPPAGATTPFSSSSMRSRSRSMFLRRGSRVMRRQRSGPSSSRQERAEEFTFKELAEATNNFSPETKIGAGSFGTVYRGKLADGREVAIKRSETGPKTNRFQEKETAFQSELAFLSRLHHKHLVDIVGYCEEGDERHLVYEYMKNGALYDHLHSDSSNSLLHSWKMRIRVLLDASRGIEYLHNYAVPHIIHRDIKSSNILLDGNWTARVSDFGLSLNGPAPPNALMRAAGTVGYIDPEYYGLHHLTVKSDVYGLGVVMLEVITGKRAVFIEDKDGDPISVVDYAVPAIAEGEVARVLDKRVPVSGASETEAVELVAYTAMHCVKLEGKERPVMSDVVANLENAFAICDHSSSHGSYSSASISPNSE